MKRIATALALLVVAVADPTGVASAQDAASLEAGLAALRSKNRFLISGSLALDADEATAFWPLYEEHQRAMQPLDARNARLIAELLRSYDALTPERAEALVNEHLRIQEDRLKLLRSHVRKARKALPPAKLARYVQLENRLELMARYDLAQRLPLVN